MEKHKQVIHVSRIVLLLLLLTLSGCSLYTVRPLNSSGTPANPSQQQFDAKTYAESVWESKVIPTVEDKAVVLPELLTALKADDEAAKKQYGHQEGNGPYTFMTQGTARVIAVDTESRNGTLVFDLAPYDGKADATLQIGPVIVGSAIRDGVGFIHFNQFTNQIQYAEVADALNEHAVKVAQELDVKTINGKTITFYGLFPYTSLQRILITPVKLTLEEASS